jgi:hypothetical protein
MRTLLDRVCTKGFYFLEFNIIFMPALRRIAKRNLLVDKMISGAGVHRSAVERFVQNPRASQASLLALHQGQRLTASQARYLKESVGMLRRNAQTTSRFMRAYTPEQVAQLFERKFGVEIVRELNVDPQTVRRILDQTAKKRGILAITADKYAPKPMLKQTPFGVEFVISQKSFDKIAGNVPREERGLLNENQRIVLGQADKLHAPNGSSVYFSLVPEQADRRTREHELAHTEEFVTNRKNTTKRSNPVRDAQYDYLRTEFFARLKSESTQDLIPELKFYADYYIENHSKLTPKEEEMVREVPLTVDKVLKAGLAREDLAELVKTLPFEKLNARLNLIYERLQRKNGKRPNSRIVSLNSRKQVGGIFIPSAEDIEMFGK